MRGEVVYRFGPFELDPTSRQLLRERRPVRLSTAQFAILCHLVTHAGVVVSKETLIQAGWGGAAITENSLGQAILRVRKVLGDGGDTTYIETLHNEGYRFSARVQQADRISIDPSLEVHLAPYRALAEGRAQLRTLDREAILRARRAFEDTLREVETSADAHIGVAMACGLAFEATAVDAYPDLVALEVGTRHARQACALAPDSGDAWSTLAFLLSLRGETAKAAAAAYKGMALAPNSWQPALHAAYVTWGEERLRAARRVLTLCPDFALAHWLITTVIIARGTPEAALEELRKGCDAQDKQDPKNHYPAVGLHLLHGLVLGSLDRLDEAVAALTRELAYGESGQLYARECAANTWYALGAIRLRQEKRAEAHAAFARALTIVPGQIAATAALHGHVPPGTNAITSALGQAIILARANRHADAARVYRDALVQLPAGPDGWLLPVEPMLNPLAHRDVWADALALVRRRAE